MLLLQTRADTGKWSLVLLTQSSVQHPAVLSSVNLFRHAANFVVAASGETPIA
jgi:hypothetical protein